MTRLFYTSSVDRFDPEREHLVTYPIGCHLTIDDAEEAVHLAAERLDTLGSGKGPWAALPKIACHTATRGLTWTFSPAYGQKIVRTSNVDTADR